MSSGQQGAVPLWQLCIPRGCSLPCVPKELAGDTCHGQWHVPCQRGPWGWQCCSRAQQCPSNGLLLLGQHRLFGAFGDAQALNSIDFLHQWCCCCHPSSRKPVPVLVHPACSIRLCLSWVYCTLMLKEIMFP